MAIQTTDQLGNTLTIPFPPQRIISLVPSQTELLFDLGLEERIVGITRFCIHPADKVQQKQKIGGTKQFDIEKIKQLQPDLVIGNKEENYEEGIVELQKHFPVWMSDIYTLPDALNMMREIGRITGTDKQAEEIIKRIHIQPAAQTGKTAAYFIWRKPYMVAGANTFINEMLKAFGVTNCFEQLQRYPEIEPTHLAERKPDFIFLSSEPYSFREIHLEEFKKFSPSSIVVLVDGEMFSWYGSRLCKTAQYFVTLQKELGI
jgi:ABC-type Fe3+-hydroxamate transport system substrate-binding protein